MGRHEDRPLSALPSPRARALAFAAIVLAGVCGGLIGASLVNLQCQGDCVTPSGIGAVLGALSAAGGVAVVAVLVLRAMGEWKSIQDQAGPGTGPGADGGGDRAVNP